MKFIVIFSLIIISLVVVVSAVSAGETRIFHLDKCSEINIKIDSVQGIDDGEFDFPQCNKISMELWECFCTDNFDLEMVISPATINDYTITIEYQWQTYAQGSATKKLPVYYKDKYSSLIKKADSSKTLDYLFHNEFDIARVNIEVFDSCSIRARGGNIIIKGVDYGSNNDANFYCPLPNANNGNGYISAQNGRDRAQMTFDVVSVELEDDKLVFQISGKLKIKQTKPEDFSGILYFDMDDMEISLVSDAVSMNDMSITFIKGCIPKKKDAFLMLQTGKLTETRTIEEVRGILNENPEFVSNFQNLRRLFMIYWWWMLFH